MFKDDLLRKVRDEERLTTAEEALLDEALNSTAHEAIKSSVKALPDEEVSMAWRSNLNGRLAELGKSVEKRRRSLMIWRPALGLGLAGALALALTLKMPGPDKGVHVYSPPVEQTLVNEHLEAMRATELAGVGLASHEAHPTPQTAMDELYDWQRVDVESL